MNDRIEIFKQNNEQQSREKNKIRLSFELGTTSPYKMEISFGLPLIVLKIGYIFVLNSCQSDPTGVTTWQAKILQLTNTDIFKFYYY